MARLLRVLPVGIPVHLIQRGNNRQACFAAPEDYTAYLNWLKEYSFKFSVEIHTWVLMTNHVHVLCTPREQDAVSQMMQSLGRRYVQYFNYQYQRSGTLWEGRYHSCLVQAEDYLLTAYRYIELNPVRANMVDDPAQYRWSSYPINGLGKSSDLCTPHQEYLRPGSNREERMKNYRALFKVHVDSDLITDIRQSLHTGMAFGNDYFKEEVEKLTGRRFKPQKVGRPKGWRRKKSV